MWYPIYEFFEIFNFFDLVLRLIVSGGIFSAIFTFITFVVYIDDINKVKSC